MKIRLLAGVLAAMALASSVLAASPVTITGPDGTQAAVGASGVAVQANAGTNLNTSALALDTSVDGIEGLLTTNNTNTGAPGATACSTDTASCSQNQQLQRLAQRLTSLITALGTPAQDSSVDQLEGYVDGLEALLGTTNTNTSTIGTDLGAPGATTCASDTASCSTNQQLQRIAQRLTSIIAGITVNAGTNLNTSALALDTSVDGLEGDFGAPGATVCATDTGSCSLNAQIQRLLQRLTTIIAGIPVTAATTGGATAYHLAVAASDNHAVIKNGAGTAYSIDGTSIHTAYQNVRLYDAGTGFNGCNSATGLLWGGLLPGAATGAGFIVPLGGGLGLAFSTGLAICVTGAIGDTDTTNATASVARVNVGYK